MLYVGISTMEAVAVLVPLLFLLWLIRLSIGERFKSRPCPRCGWRVRNGVLDCPHCAHDFRTVDR